MSANAPEMVPGEPIAACPFCGGDAEIWRQRRFPNCPDDWAGAWAYYGLCRSCAAQGPWEKSESSARKGWNRRES